MDWPSCRSSQPLRPLEAAQCLSWIYDYIYVLCQATKILSPVWISRLPVRRASDLADGRTRRLQVGTDNLDRRDRRGSSWRAPRSTWDRPSSVLAIPTRTWRTPSAGVSSRLPVRPAADSGLGPGTPAVDGKSSPPSLGGGFPPGQRLTVSKICRMTRPDITDNSAAGPGPGDASRSEGIANSVPLVRTPCRQISILGRFSDRAIGIPVRSQAIRS